MSKLPAVSKKQLAQELKQIRKDIRNADTKYTCLLSEWKDSLAIYTYLIKRQTKLWKKLYKEREQCDRLEQECQKVEQRKCFLERHQQYREEPEWQMQLECEYRWQVRWQQKFGEDLVQKELFCYRVEQQLQQLKELEEQEKKKVDLCKKNVRQHERDTKGLIKSLKAKKLEYQHHLG